MFNGLGKILFTIKKFSLIFWFQPFDSIKNDLHFFLPSIGYGYIKKEEFSLFFYVLFFIIEFQYNFKRKDHVAKN